MTKRKIKQKQFRCIICQAQFETQEECIEHEMEFKHHIYDVENSKLRLCIG